LRIADPIGSAIDPIDRQRNRSAAAAIRGSIGSQSLPLPDWSARSIARIDRSDRDRTGARDCDPIRAADNRIAIRGSAATY
jgi:hypothetical protein